MTPPQKPGWLEPNEDATSHRMVSRGFRVLAITAVVTLIGAGAIFAQPQEVIVANTSGTAAVLNTAQQDSTVTPPILNFPAVGALSEDDEDFFDFYDFYGFDDDDFDDDEEDDDFDDDEDDEDEEDDEDDEDEEDDD